MDTSGFSQIGRYGTLSLMKRQEVDTVVTAFGIDTEELTFGRDPNCGVRLYYPDINLVHCKITFTDRKAFLVVLGSAGLLVDGCKIYPNGTPGGQPTTIPLLNDSEIEIHGKRFRFSYPPKEMRAALLATPARNNRRLRLSMIHSAQVFSPRPSKDPRENLKILRSPMKNAFRSPVKSSMLSRPPNPPAPQEEDEAQDDEDQEIVLVDGDHPRVVEEDKDLVILEDIEAPLPQPAIQVQQPKTPQRRRSQSLHRAVLIRSAQRRVIEHEKQRQQEEEEREEEMEVLDTIGNVDISNEEPATHHPDHDEQDDYPRSDEETDSDEDEIRDERDQEQRKSLWRKSFEKLWPFRSSSPTDAEVAKDEMAEHEEPEESSEEDDEETEREEAQDQPEALPSLHQPTPIRRPLGSFMTPQAGQKSGPFDRGQSLEPSRGRLGGGPPVRYSMGGEARRVPLESAWRVRDLVVPLKSEAPVPVVESSATVGTPHRLQNLGQAQASPVRSRLEVSAEERKAIQERRRSALRTDSHTYFAGGIPGMSPSKAPASPTKSGFNDANNPFRAVSPTKIASSQPVEEVDRRLSIDEEDEKLDTRSLLERMKETVEGMKRRRSTFGLPTSHPINPSDDANPFNDNVDLQPEDDSNKENDENAMAVDVNSEPLVLLRSPNKNLRKVRAIKEKSQEPAVYGAPAIPIIVKETATDAQLDDERSRSTTVVVPTRRSLSRTRSRSPQPPSEPTLPPVTRRTRKATAEPEEASEAPGTDAPKRNTRKPTRTADQEEPLIHTATTQSRRARKPTTESNESQPTRRGRKTPTVEEEPAPAPRRNLRKVTVKEEKDDGAAPARRGRAPSKAAGVAAGAEKEKHGPTKRTTTRTRGTKTAQAQAQADSPEADDPLNAFNDSEEAPTDAAPQPSKITAQARKPRAAVKQEESTNEVLKASTKTRTVAKTTAKTPAPTRSRARKTPATAPAATEVEVDKENAPGDGTSAGNMGDADEGVVVKVRATRKTKTVPVKQETQEATTAAQPKTRTTRTTRVRTRTT
ncbi:hypothetical protein D9756_008541 [Leucocoprinus leucothites]|uniref:FHA domain-containing protein n=1 Tax=Leucocoprinus leucothites TaxID=201217 RepID=A0A8H5FVH8_9AGAR|nr:hypothetical protein D9756_008541 [Leucoagaricus leucothites]